MTPIARIPRTRGAFSGVMLVLLGAWGGLVAFIGPYFHFAYTPDKAWVYTTERLWLEILPGAATVLGGLLVLGSARRHTAAFALQLMVISEHGRRDDGIHEGQRRRGRGEAGQRLHA